MSFIEDQEERAYSVSDVRIYSANEMRPEDNLRDDELRKLSEYFEKSREEIQKKVNSLLSFDFNSHKSKNILESSSKTSLESESSKTLSTKNYIPIDLETAISLRQLTVGSCVHTFSNEWRRAKFIFRPENSELSYGLYSEKNGSKGLILSAQAMLLKTLILMGYKDINGNEVISSEWRNNRKILNPNDQERKDALIKTLTNILWTAGEKEYSCVCLNSNSNCFDILESSKKTKYCGDGLTERLHLYEFSNYGLLLEFIKKNFANFQKEDGCILFLYSLILSRKINRLKEDLQESNLLGDMEECKISLFNLVLSGYASPYLHNGSVYYTSEGQALVKPLIGIKTRNDVGILYWDSKEDDKKRTEVGSMLKTPKFPIWLTLMGKNTIAILFNTNIELMNNWRLEQNFILYFYSGLKKQEIPNIIDISIRDTNNLILDTPKYFKSKYSNLKFFEEEKDAEVFEAIKSKWPDSIIAGVDGKDLMALL